MATTSKIDIIFSPQVNSKLTNVGDLAYLIDKKQLVVRTSAGIQYQGMTLQEVRRIMDAPLAILEATVDHIVKNGDGTLFLADDGTYKEVAGGGSGGVTKDELVGYEEVVLDISSLFSQFMLSDGMGYMASLEIANSANDAIISEMETFFGNVGNGKEYTSNGVTGYVKLPEQEGFPFPQLDLAEEGISRQLFAGDLSQFGFVDPGFYTVIWLDGYGKELEPADLIVSELVEGLVPTLKEEDINTKVKEPSFITGELLSKYKPNTKLVNLLYKTPSEMTFIEFPEFEDLGDGQRAVKGPAVADFINFLESADSGIINKRYYWLNGMSLKLERVFDVDDNVTSYSFLKRNNIVSDILLNINRTNIDESTLVSYSQGEGEDYIGDKVELYEDLKNINIVSHDTIRDKNEDGMFITPKLLGEVIDKKMLWTNIASIKDVEQESIITYDSIDPVTRKYKYISPIVVGNVKSEVTYKSLAFHQDLKDKEENYVLINGIEMKAYSFNKEESVSFQHQVSFFDNKYPNMTFDYSDADRSKWFILSSFKLNSLDIKIRKRRLETVLEGDGTKFLADDGTYKEVAGGSGGGDVEDLSDMTNNGFTISEVAGVNTLTAYDKVKKKVVVPSGVIAIGEATDPDPQVGVGVFELEGDNAQYNFIILPDGLQTIGTKAFCNVELGSRLDIPSTVTDINPAAFMDFYMYSDGGLVLPKGLININPAAFTRYYNGEDGNVNYDLIIPESVELIGEFAFEDASGIRTLYIRCGYSATISDSAFRNVQAEEIVFTSIEAPSFGLDVFDGYMGNIYVPDQALEDYNNIPGNVIPFKPISEREEEGGE